MPRAPKGPPVRRRPYPPTSDAFRFTPAPELAAWIAAEILDEAGSLFNPDHKHLRAADVGYLWAAGGFSRQGRQVLGMAERVQCMGHRWAKERAEYQLEQWFGHVPDFLVTLAGDYCARCSDAEFCALLEHELYHVGHEHRGGVPQFTQNGRPRLAIRGHDVEEFVGVVRRYGAGSDSSVAALAAAARMAPEVGVARIGAACGVCALRVA